MNWSYEVYIIYGDGAAGYSLVEYDTFKRHNLNIVSIIGNDACWSQILREQIEILKDDVACKLEYSEYQKIGEAFDCKGYISKNNQGMGLGIFISKNLIENMGGNIKFNNSKDEKAVVEIIFENSILNIWIWSY